MKSNISKHPCANKCTDFKEEQCKTCLVPDAKQWYDVPNHHILEQSEKSDFLVGDVVVFIDAFMHDDIMTVHKVQSDGILLDGNRKFALAHLLRHASTAELKLKRRLTDAELAMAEVS